MKQLIIGVIAFILGLILYLLFGAIGIIIALLAFIVGLLLR